MQRLSGQNVTREIPYFEGSRMSCIKQRMSCSWLANFSQRESQRFPLTGPKQEC